MYTTARVSYIRRFVDIWLQHSAKFFLFSALCIHALEIPVCLFLDSLPLLFLNGLSCSIYLLLLHTEKKRPDLAVTFAEVEVLFFSISASSVAGLASGFFLYLICLLAISSYLSDAVKHCSVAAVQVLDLEGIVVLLCISSNIPLKIEGVPALSDAALHILFVMNLLICVCTTLLSVYLSSQTLRRRNQELEAANRNLEYIASHDPLTGLQNRRNLYKQLESLCLDADRDGTVFCAAMADIDDFKSFNDQYGHSHGDLVLTTIASCACSRIGEKDIICRWGGEEILILFVNTSITAAKNILVQIQSDLHALTAVRNPPFFQEVTLTFGLAQHIFGQSAQELVSEVDRLLYRGKLAGKNCVVC